MYTNKTVNMVPGLPSGRVEWGEPPLQQRPGLDLIAI